MNWGKEIKIESITDIAVSLLVFYYYFFLISQLGLRGSQIPEPHIRHKKEKTPRKFTSCFSFQKNGKEEMGTVKGNTFPSCLFFALLTWLSLRQAAAIKLYVVDAAAMHITKNLGETLSL